MPVRAHRRGHRRPQAAALPARAAGVHGGPGARGQGHGPKQDRQVHASHVPPREGAAALRRLSATGGAPAQPLPGGMMRTRLALLAVAAAAAFLGTYAISRADEEGSSPAPAEVQARAAVPASP